MTDPMNTAIQRLSAQAAQGDARAAGLLRTLVSARPRAAAPSHTLGSPFRPGPGAPKVGAYGMPETNTPGVALGPVARLAFPGVPSGDQQSRARFALFAGQKLTAAQTQELITMMTLAAMGIGPVVANTYNVPAPTYDGGGGGGGGGGGLDAMTQALKDKAKRAKAAADAAALAAAYAKAAKNPALLHAMMLQANTSWSRDNAQAQPSEGPPVTASAGPSGPPADPSLFNVHTNWNL